MTDWVKHSAKMLWLASCLLCLSVASCTAFIFDDRDGCERGVYVNIV